MWSRCWWATWVSGFFGIFGLLHLARVAVPFRLVIGSYEVSRTVTAVAGVICLALSASLLLVEAQRERIKRCAKN